MEDVVVPFGRRRLRVPICVDAKGESSRIRVTFCAFGSRLSAMDGMRQKVWVKGGVSPKE